MIRTWFGPLPNWMDQYLANVAKLKQYGFDFWLCNDYEWFRRRVKETLSLDVNIKPGTRKVADLDPAYGEIFAPEIRAGRYDFWGHTNLDLVFGRLDRWVTDRFLDSLDVFGGDPNAINGIFSFYRNGPAVNSLFRRAPDWRECFQDPELWGWDETHFSRVVRQAHAQRLIRFRSAFWHTNDQMDHQKPPSLRFSDEGDLIDVPLNRTIPLYHFNKTRRWPIR